jgi:hypothetical protein
MNGKILQALGTFSVGFVLPSCNHRLLSLS